MNERAPADQAARDRALDVGASFIVQAPAGSGKTELLIQRCLALLATLEEPESLIAITFTRKAAAEMRERILGALREAGSPGSGPVRLEPRTLALAAAALAADARRGWGLLANPGRLRIQTIDALNLGLARRLPVLSGLGAALSVEEHADVLYRQAAQQLLSQLADGAPEHTAAIARVLAHLDNRAPLFIELIVGILRRREAWVEVLPGGNAGEESPAATRGWLEAARLGLVRTHLASLLDRFPQRLLAEAVEIARASARELERTGLTSPITAWAAAPGLPDAEPASASLWSALAELFLTREGVPRLRGGLNRNQGFPAGKEGQPAKMRADTVLDALRAEPVLCQRLDATRQLPPPEYDEREWTVLQSLLTVLRLAVAELELVFAGRRMADYPRFAAAARAALGDEDAPTDTALALDARLRHVLVDEFQDTSDAQVRLLESLTAGWQPGDGRSLFLVGDPMQSIYRFRDAEVGLFLSVRDHGLRGLRLEPLALGVNFRSTVPVVAWLNDAFSRVLPERDDVQRGAVAYLPVATSPGAATEGGVIVHPLLGADAVREAREVADIVAGRLAEPGSGTIAVLVQGRRHLVQIVAELARRGIGFRANDIDPLLERPIVLDLLSLARSLAHPGDRTAWLAVLRAPWCGLTLADLHALAADEPAQAVIELLRDPARRSGLAAGVQARTERVWALLEQGLIERRRHGLREAVERTWNSLGGPATAESARSLDEAEAFLDVLAQCETRDGPVLDLAALAEALERLHAPTQPDPGLRVELATIHKAKGLQFDTVIVPGLQRRLGRDDRPLIRWSPQIEGTHATLLVAPLAQTGGEPNLLFEWLGAQEQEKLLHERRRLLYVAATRARRWLHLVGSCAVGLSDTGLLLKRPGAATMLGMLWPVVEPVFLAQLTAAGAPAHAAVSPPSRDPPLSRFPPGWEPPAPPPAPPLVVHATSAVAVSAVTFDWASQTARHVGTVVHRELQHFGGRGDTEFCDGAATRARIAAELAELGVPADGRAAAVERAISAVQSMLADARGRWVLAATHAEAATELALSGRINGALVRGVIDRSFVVEDGVRWIIDYKLSPHEGGALEEFLDREQLRYRDQLERYAVLARRLGPQPVRVALYFPLQRAWREWGPAGDYSPTLSP